MKGHKKGVLYLANLAIDTLRTGVSLFSAGFEYVRNSCG